MATNTMPISRSMAIYPRFHGTLWPGPRLPAMKTAVLDLGPVREKTTRGAMMKRKRIGAMGGARAADSEAEVQGQADLGLSVAQLVDGMQRDPTRFDTA